MSEPAFNSRSPGEMLRLAREAQGVHIAALAAAIKVAPRKLDALEHDRWDELPDAVFVRALAQTVCRTLKIDATPVLALLPRAGVVALAPAHGGLNAPFHDRPGRDDPGLSLGAIRPMVVAASVLMVAAIAVYFLPDGVWLGAASKMAMPAVAVAASAPSAVSVAVPEAASAEAMSASASEPALALETALPSAAVMPATIPAVTPAAMPAAMLPALAPITAPAAAPLAAASSAGVLQLRTSAASWVEVRDAKGRALLSRLLAAGESLGVDGQPPLRLTIGNAAATQLAFRGQAVDLRPSTRDNVARVELP